MHSLYKKSNLAKSKNNNPSYSCEVSNVHGQKVKCADPRAIRSLLMLMDLQAVNAGAACHWGGPSAIAEILSALHHEFFMHDHWFNHYNFVNDIGHAENAIYATRSLFKYADISFDTLKGFRSMHSKLTGHGESHLFPEAVLLSNGPLGSALPQAQGLAMADKLLNISRLTICLVSDGAAMEGEAKEAFAAIPGLMQKNKINPFLMILSDNNTKLSGRIDQDAFSMKPTFDSLDTLGWHIISEYNGNNLEACYQSLKKSIDEAQTKNKPVCLWLKTIKGYGIKETEQSKSGGHGFPLKAHDEKIFNFLQEIWNNQCPEEFINWANSLVIKPNTKSSSSEVKEKIQDGFARALIKMKKQGMPVVSISADLQGSTGLAAFHKEFPADSIDIGVAESNMVSCAAGLSKAGLIPIVDTFAAFGVTKGNLPLIMASLSSSPVICVFSHTGFQDAADGASHQSLTYFSALAAIPNLEIIIPATSSEAEYLMTQAIEKFAEAKKNHHHEKSYVFFVGRESYSTSLQGQKDHHQGSYCLKNGKDLVILANGPLLHEAIKASHLLEQKNIFPTIINNTHPNCHLSPEISALVDSCQGRLLTVEDHQLIAGMGANAVGNLSQGKSPIKRLKSLGVKALFGQSAYSALELYEKHGLNAQSIADSAEELIK